MKKCITLIILLITSHSVTGQDQQSDSSTKKTLFDKAKEKFSSDDKTEIFMIDTITKKVAYSNVVSVSDQTKKELYDKGKKWIQTKHSDNNPYSISFENEQNNSFTGKGTFTLPVEGRKYGVQFVISIATKDNKYKYSFTDFVLLYRTNAGSSGGGFGYYSGSSHKEAETLEYTLETFYPSRMHSRKPEIKYYEDIRSAAFKSINREILSIVNSFEQAMNIKEDW